MANIGTTMYHESHLQYMMAIQAILQYKWMMVGWWWFNQVQQTKKLRRWATPSRHQSCHQLRASQALHPYVGAYATPGRGRAHSDAFRGRGYWLAQSGAMLGKPRSTTCNGARVNFVAPSWSFGGGLWWRQDHFQRENTSAHKVGWLIWWLIILSIQSI